MLHQLLKIDGLNIAYSEIINDHGDKKIRIYSDKFNATTKKINEMEFYLPDYKITKLIGFSAKDIEKIFNHIKCAEDIIWDRAKENR